MTEIELMRDLEKAALGFVGDPHRYRAIATSNDEMDAVKAALAALSAYRAQPQEAEGETVAFGVWTESNGCASLFIAGSPDDKAPSPNWTRIGSTIIHIIPAKVGT